MTNKYLFGAGVLVGVAAVAAMRLAGGGVAADVSYSDLPLATKVAKAPLIVTGTVVDVSPTRWNQDDGTFWEETVDDAYGTQTVDSAVPYHVVTIKIDRTLADTLGVTASSGGKVAVTVVGMRDGGGFEEARKPDGAPGVLALSSDSVSANAGERVVAFVRPGQLAWRGGAMRAVLAPMGSPGTTVLSEAVVNSGAFAEVPSFDALVARVEQARTGAADQ